jgi:fibronectin-binding autotransporter adhesin
MHSMEIFMRPVSSRALTFWITGFCLVTAVFSLNGAALGQTAPGSKRKLSQQALQVQLPAATKARPTKNTAPPPQTTDTWTGAGGTSNWSNASNWNNGSLGTGENVLINLTNAATVDDFNASIGNLTLSNAGDSVTLTGATLTVDGTITNNGSINLAATAGGSQGVLYIGGNSTLTGTGALVLENGPTQNFITGASGAILTNQSTIEGGWIPSGAGYAGIGQGQIALANSGTINANLAGGVLNLDPTGSVTSTNTGTLEATNGATLQMQGGTWTQTGAGTISAATGSTVALQSGVSITGGTLTTAGTGLFAQNNGGTVSLSNLTNNGNYQIQISGGQTNLSGTITNNGTISLLANAYGAQGILNLTANTTLAGSGTVVIGNETTQNFITGTNGLTLTNDSTIEGGVSMSGGYAAIGQGQIALANNGVINANVSGGILYLDPNGSLTSTNTATLEATNGSTLEMSGGTWTQNGAGTITAAAGSTVGLQSNVSITGGTLTTVGSGVIAQNDGGTVYLSNLTNAGNYQIQVAGGQTDISGTITNNGTISLLANSYGAQGILNLTANTTLTGSGAVVIGNETTQNFLGGSGAYTLTNASTIEGGVSNSDGFAGIGNGQIILANTGTINANVTGGLLYVNPLGSATNTNTGTMEATNGGILVLDGSSWNNAGGTITAANTSTVTLENGVSITGGMLTSSGSGIITQNAGGNVYLTSLTNAGVYDLVAGQTNIAGTINNTGTINLQSNGQAWLYVGTSSTLTGIGAVVLGNQANQNFINGASGATLTNASTIEGGSTFLNGGYDQIGIGNLILVNSGTIDANVNGGQLYLTPFASATSPSTNTGTMEATNGGILIFDGSSWTNKGKISAAANSAVDLQNGVSITGGTLTTTGNGVIQVLNGQTVSLNSVTNTGTLNVLDSATTQISGTINNTGTINLDSAGNYTILYLTGNATLAGTGAVVMGSGGPNFIDGVAGAVLTNNSTIEGTGYIGNGHLTITNNGTFDSNVTGGTLAISPGSGGFTNYNGTTTTLTGGTYISDAGNITFNAGNSTGITTLAAKVTEEAGGQLINTFNGANTNALAGLTSITSTGALTIGGVAFTDAAAFSNAGSLTILSGESFTVGSLTQISGTTLAAGTYVLDANLSLTGATESITTNSATLTLGGGTIENANNTNALAGLTSNTRSLTLANNANFTTAGSFSNTGELTVNSGSTFTVTGALSQYKSASNALQGGTFVVGGTLALAAGAKGIETDASNITMDGTGTFKNTTSGANANALVKLSAIASTGSFALASDANFTTAANFTNSGKLTVNAGSKLTVTGTLSNLSSGTLTGGTYTIGGTLQLASANGGITTNAASLTLTGTTAKILDGTANALSTFDNNTGTLDLASGITLVTANSTFTNSGTVDVAKGTIFEAGTGAAKEYSQTAGTTTVDGTLAGGGTTGISITGGTLLGAGTLHGNTSNSASISAGDAGKAGLLTITGTYTQLASGSLNVNVGGTTVGTLYSQVKISGKASLGGTLAVTLVNSFTPTIGQTFTVLTAAGGLGGTTFSNSTIAINSSEQFDISYTSTGVVLTVVSTAPSNSNKSAQPDAVLAAADPTKATGKSTPVSAHNDLRHAVATGISKHFEIASVGSENRKLALSYGDRVNAPRVWEHVPVAPSWDHVKATPVGQALRANLGGARSDLAHRVNGWAVTSQALPVQAPARGWAGATNLHRFPMRLLPTTLPAVR